MNGLPSGWVNTNLSEITRSHSGNSKLIKGKLLQSPENGAYPAYSASGQDVWHTAYEHEGDSIIVSAVGARCGKSFLAQGRWSAIANTHVVWPSAAIDQKYLYLHLNNEGFWDRGGSAQPFVKVSSTFSRPFPLPPHAEQKRIVAKMESLKANSGRARSELSKIPRLVAKYKKAFLASVFPVQENLMRLGQLASFVTSGSRGWAKYYSDDGAAFIRVGNVRRDHTLLELSELQYVRPPQGSEGERTHLREADIVITITADLGRIGLVPPTLGEAYVNQHVALVRLKNVEYAPYIAWFLMSDHGQSQLLERNRGATRAGLGLDDIRAVSIPLPPLSEQQDIASQIEAAFSKIDGLAREAKRALELTDRLDEAILAKALRGELVPQNPMDEPAALLLDRVRADHTKTPRSRRNRDTAKGTTPRAPVARGTMTKSRFDDDVKGKPYLAEMLRSGLKAVILDPTDKLAQPPSAANAEQTSAHRALIESLFKQAQLPVADFYKQLAWEIDNGYILDDNGMLKAS